jgi:hypothetical protein
MLPSSRNSHRARTGASLLRRNLSFQEFHLKFQQLPRTNKKAQPSTISTIDPTSAWQF